MSEKIIAQNRKAFFEYFINETYEAGIVLLGSEVKSLRLGRVNLKDSFGKVDNEELYLFNMNISPYAFAHQFNHDPERKRKLLLHKREIKKLIEAVQEKGMTLVPTKIYFKDGKCKVEIAVAKGKKLFDKRETIKEKDAKRELQRAFKKER